MNSHLAYSTQYEEKGAEHDSQVRSRQDYIRIFACIFDFDEMKFYLVSLEERNEFFSCPLYDESSCRCTFYYTSTHTCVVIFEGVWKRVR